MASAALKTGLALTISLGLLPLLPTDAVARGGEGRRRGGSSTSSSRLYFAGTSESSPAAHNRCSKGCSTHHWDNCGIPLLTPGKSRATLEGNHRQLQEGVR